MHQVCCVAQVQSVLRRCGRLCASSSRLRPLRTWEWSTRDNLSWKSAAGVAQQTRCYSLLAVIDLCFAAEAPKLLDASTTAAAVTAVQCLLDTRERLLNWLQGASRPKALTGTRLAPETSECKDFAASSLATRQTPARRPRVPQSALRSAESWTAKGLTELGNVLGQRCRAACRGNAEESKRAGRRGGVCAAARRPQVAHEQPADGHHLALLLCYPLRRPLRGAQRERKLCDCLRKTSMSPGLRFVARSGSPFKQNDSRS